MTTDHLSALEAAATPYLHDKGCPAGRPPVEGVLRVCLCRESQRALNREVVAARNVMPELLAVVRAAEEYVSRAPDSHGTALFDDLRDALAALHAKVQP